MRDRDEEYKERFFANLINEYQEVPGYEPVYEKCPQCEQLVPRAEIVAFVGICGSCRGYYLREELRYD
ncbi:MAG: hypothetical protein JNN15_05040 [Blastocatellia bacterium]|nr:hypothetical protein [Blastocatellia bacterium]